MKKFITASELCDRYGLSRTAIYHLSDTGQFPRGIKIGKTRRWDLSEIENFEQQQGGLING